MLIVFFVTARSRGVCRRRDFSEAPIVVYPLSLSSANTYSHSGFLHGSQAKAATNIFRKGQGQRTSYRNAKKCYFYIHCTRRMYDIDGNFRRHIGIEAVLFLLVLLYRCFIVLVESMSPPVPACPRLQQQCVYRKPPSPPPPPFRSSPPLPDSSVPKPTKSLLHRR